MAKMDNLNTIGPKKVNRSFKYSKTHRKMVISNHSKTSKITGKHKIPVHCPFLQCLGPNIAHSVHHGLDFWINQWHDGKMVS